MKGSQHEAVRQALGLGLAAAICVPAAAQAQERPPARTGAAAQQEAAPTVGEIVVTARQRRERLIDTPVAVSAVTPAVLASAASPDVRDLAGRTPNLVIDQLNAGPSAAAVAIRGVSFEDIEKSFDPAVGVLLDGVYLGTNTGALADTFDLESIQILRGPQGTLFGRNTIGGVVSVTRSRPTGVFGGKFDTVQGDYGRHEYHGVLNLPEVGGQLSAKAFYTRQQSDGYYRNVTLGRTDTGATDVERFGVALLWRPVSRFDLLATVERAVEHSSNDNASLSITGQLICLPYGPPLTAPATECNRRGRDDVYTTFSNRAGPVHNREDALTATATWRPGRFTATAVTGLRSSRELAITDFDASSIDFYDVVRPQRYRQFSQELRLQGPVTRFADVVIGAYYFRSRYSIDQVTNFGPLFQIAGSPASVLTRVGQISRSYAVFGDAVITPLPRLRVTVGGRYTWDRKSIRDELVGQFNIKGEKDWSQFTPKVSVDYHLATDVMAYGSYSKGYRAGGFNGRATTITSATVPYNPETVDTYEAGLKAELANRRLRLNLAAFTSDYRNKQEEVVAATPVGSPDPQETLVVNAATARIRGVEFDGEADVGARLTVRASLGILDASYRRFEQVDAAYSTPTQRVYDDLTGLRLRRAPKLTAGVDVAYRIPVGSDEISLDASYRHVASYATTVATDVGTATYVGPGCAPGKVEVAGCSYVPAANYSNTTAPPADTVDASATYRFQVSKTSLGVSIFVRNLLDNRGLSFALPAAGLFTFGYARPPRSYGVRLSGSF